MTYNVDTDKIDADVDKQVSKKASKVGERAKSNGLNARVALVHDFLIQMGGAERVVEVMAEDYPEAPIYTSATKSSSLFPAFSKNRVVNSWMQHIPNIEKFFKKLFFLYPFAFKCLKIDPKLDVVWISSSSFSKWINKPSGAKFICYCHTPPRFFWRPDAYLENEVANPLLRKVVKLLMPIFRWSDKRQADKVDVFIANSANTQEQIKRCYGRDSVVLYPPVDVERFRVSDRKEDFFLIVSRLVSYKKIDVAVQAFTKANRKLVIIGDGPDRSRLEGMAGPTIEFLGRAPDDVVEDKMASCLGFVFPGFEDFGITPVEAQACGKPIVAFRGGGALETVVDLKTGVFFDDFDPELVIEALEQFDALDWDAETIRKNAERFSISRYLTETRELLEMVAQ